MTIGIVTDSTAYLSEQQEIELGVKVVPVLVVVEGKSFSDITEFSTDQLVAALREQKSVTTSRPSVQSFIDTYNNLHNAGASEIISIHISSELSGTFESALLATQKVDFQVSVIDSRGVAGFIALAVTTAAKLRDEGKNSAEIFSEVNNQCANMKMYFYVDTLEYLKRGGLISSVKSKLGQMFTIKPLLTMENGRVELLELVRSESKALSRLVELACSDGADHQFAINHVAASARASALYEAICDRLKIDSIEITQVGAVVGTHVGPGAVAISIN